MKYIITLNDKRYEVEVNETEAVLTSVYEATPAQTLETSTPSPAPAAAAAPVAQVAGSTVTSPMPGTILAVNVKEGQAVKSGEVLMILEAMKMENEIVAPCDGKVKQLLVSKGSTVDTDQTLAVL